MLPINIRCAVTAELVGDELRGLPNGLQFDTHSVPIVGHDLERQWRGVVQYREFHCAIIELDASNVERVALNAIDRNRLAYFIGPSSNILLVAYRPLSFAIWPSARSVRVFASLPS
jgi:hypothetical protein